MAAIAELTDLKAADAALKSAKFTKAQLEVLKAWGPKVGWKNLMHMLVYRKTPEDVKSGKRK